MDVAIHWMTLLLESYHPGQMSVLKPDVTSEWQSWLLFHKHPLSSTTLYWTRFWSFPIITEFHLNVAVVTTRQQWRTSWRHHWRVWLLWSSQSYDSWSDVTAWPISGMQSAGVTFSAQKPSCIGYKKVPVESSRWMMQWLVNHVVGPPTSCILSRLETTLNMRWVHKLIRKVCF